MDKDLTKKELSSNLDIAKDIAKKAGVFLASNASGGVTKDWEKDIKLVADREAHSMILKFLKKNSSFPILSEEDESHNFEDKQVQWIVDPLDGSLNYSRGFPFSAVSIALSVNGKPKLGVVYDFNRDELFYGTLGLGAWKDNDPMFVSKIKQVSKAILVTGFPSQTSYDKESLDNYVRAVQTFKKVRLLGSAALSLSYVACGRADAYFEKDIKIWDVAGGLAIVEAAGGNYKTTKVDENGKCSIFCSNGVLESVGTLLF